MGRKICCTGKPHPDYSARKVLPDRLRNNSCQVQWDFLIYIKPIYISSLCLSLEDMARSKNKNTRSEHAMNAGSLLSECVWHSYKMKIIIQAFFFQRAFLAGNKDDSIPPPSWTPNTLEPTPDQVGILFFGLVLTVTFLIFSSRISISNKVGFIIEPGE